MGPEDRAPDFGDVLTKAELHPKETNLPKHIIKNGDGTGCMKQPL